MTILLIACIVLSGLAAYGGQGWFYWVICGVCGITLLFSLGRGATYNSNPMAEITNITRHIQDITLQKVGASGEKLKALNVLYDHWKERESEFWSSHHYENGRQGGHIVEGGPGPYRDGDGYN